MMDQLTDYGWTLHRQVVSFAWLFLGRTTGTIDLAEHSKSKFRFSGTCAGYSEGSRFLVCKLRGAQRIMSSPDESSNGIKPSPAPQGPPPIPNNLNNWSHKKAPVIKPGFTRDLKSPEAPAPPFLESSIPQESVVMRLL